MTAQKYIWYQDHGSQTDVHNEYLWVNGSWELLGNTQIVLTNYYTKTETYSKTEVDNMFPVVIENENGTAIKYEDGRLIQYGSFVKTDWDYGTVFYYNLKWITFDEQIPYQISFIEKPTIYLESASNSQVTGVCHNQNVPLDKLPLIYCFGNSNEPVKYSITINWLSIGKWK